MTTPAEPFPFERFRRLRFGGRRPPCPHCAATHVHRWGGFSGRRRYRCVACRRTFSDFTGTPLATLKRIDRWQGFCHCMLASLTVRRAAASLDVDPTTAFRWRHRLLEGLDRSDVADLDAIVTIAETAFPHSEKGKRGLDRPPRLRGGRYDPRVPSVWVLIARDQRGRVTSHVAGRSRPTANDLERALAPRLEKTAEIRDVVGPYGAGGLLVVRTSLKNQEGNSARHTRTLQYRRIARSSPEFSAMRRYMMALRSWLRRFHGVASRYLANYLAWHRLLTLAEDASPRLGFRWVLAAAFP